jgi:hypothetical protein
VQRANAQTLYYRDTRIDLLIMITIRAPIVPVL